MSRSQIKAVARKLEEICRNHGVELSAKEDDETGIFFLRFRTDTPGWNRGTRAMIKMLRYCRRHNVTHIRLNAYPIDNSEKMQITNMRLMRWYMRFGFHQTTDYEPEGCNELLLTFS